MNSAWSHEDLNGFTQHSHQHVGQINLGTPMGDTIYSIVKNDHPTIIYDIGCWNGEGSTKCITSAMSDQQTLYGFEVNADKARHTASLYKDDPRIHILHATLKQVSLADISTVFPHVASNSQLLEWCQIDIQNSSTASLFTPHEWIDLVVHDGGEWDSYFIYHEIKDRVGAWLLDDTHTDKNKLVMEDLMHDPNFVHVGGGTDRNGWAYFKRQRTN